MTSTDIRNFTSKVVHVLVRESKQAECRMSLWPMCR